MSSQYVQALGVAAARGTRLVGGCIALCGLAVIGAFMTSDGDSHGGLYPSITIYSPQNLLEAISLVVVGLLLLLVNRRTIALVTPIVGIGLVNSLLIVGTAVVAHKHWRPAVGMGSGGGFRRLDTLESLAIFMASAGVVAAGVCLGWLLVQGELRLQRPRLARSICFIAGIAIVVFVPFFVGISYAENRDATSLGAYALIYSLPWGVSVWLAAWAARWTAVAIIATVIASISLDLVLPRMPDLIFGTPMAGFALALLLASAALFVQLAATDPGSSASTA